MEERVVTSTSLTPCGWISSGRGNDLTQTQRNRPRQDRADGFGNDRQVPGVAFSRRTHIGEHASESEGDNMRIAILEDDPVQAEFIRQALTADRHTCYAFLKGTALKKQLQRDTFDLLILDWYVPDLSGQALLHWVRAREATRDLPVLFITHRSDEAGIVEILDAGGDDYLVKPVTPAILRARVGALLRRVYPADADPTRHEFAPYRFDGIHQQAFMNNVPVNLTQKEFELAWLLFQNLDRPLSRAYLIDRIWKREAYFSARTLDTHISTVRSKLDLRPANGYRLSSIYGYGYRLECLGDVGRPTYPDRPLPSEGAESSGVQSTA